MDQSNMLSIVGSIYDKLVADVADTVISRLKAEALGTLTLEPEKLQYAMLHLLETDTNIREEVRIINEEKFNEIDTRLDHNISDNDDFTDLKSTVDDLVSKLEDFESTVDDFTSKIDTLETNGTIDADDSDFADAVRSVIRNHI